MSPTPVPGSRSCVVAPIPLQTKAISGAILLPRSYRNLIDSTTHGAPAGGGNTAGPAGGGGVCGGTCGGSAPAGAGRAASASWASMLANSFDNGKAGDGTKYCGGCCK